MSDAITNIVLAAVLALFGYWLGGVWGYSIAFGFLWFCFAEGDARRTAARLEENRAISKMMRDPW